MAIRITAMLLAAILAGCAPADPKLEGTLAPKYQDAGAGKTVAAPVALGDATTSARIVLPGPVDLVPLVETPPPIEIDITGRETRVDRYGRRIEQARGAQVSETIVGSGDFRDGSGRPVQCINAGAAISCR